jgi:pimeloyl-ACP methyl ester carboxylesterase
VGEPVFLDGRAGHTFLAIYTEVPGARSGLVLVHGIGAHPDWGLIGRLRSALADDGYTTLSVQMPVLAQTAQPEQYRTTFSDAGERLKVAADFLRAKGHTKTAIVSHSMGSRMTYYYLTTDPHTSLRAWVCIGWASEGDDFDRLKLPVLDLYGEKDLPTVLESGTRRAASIDRSGRSQRIIVPAADHFFTNRQVELLRYVKDFLDKSL